MAKLLTKQEERQLIAAAQSGDEDARKTLIEKNMGLCYTWARKYTRPYILDEDDLAMTGVLGLNHAIKKFDLSRDVRFSTYAVPWIKQHIRRELAKVYYIRHTPVYLYSILGKAETIRNKWIQDIGREPSEEEIADEIGCTESQMDYMTSARAVTLSTDAAYGDSDGNNAFLDTIPDGTEFELESERKILIAECVERLEGDFREIIEHRYGLNGCPVMTLQELGDIYNLSREGVRQKEVIALSRLRTIINSRCKKDEVDDLRRDL